MIESSLRVVGSCPLAVTLVTGMSSAMAWQL
jgi:hypothetical protein